MNNFFDAIGIDLGILVVMLMVLVLVLIVLVLNVSLGLHRQRRRYNMFMKGADGQSLERVFSQKLKEVDRLSRANEQSLEEVRGLKDMLSKSLTKYGTALSGKQMTPAGATEILEVLGKEESLVRIQAAIEKLTKAAE